MHAHFEPGDVVVYRKQKCSLRPGPHARDVTPAEHGDSYSYAVEKFWRVVAVLPGDEIIVRTRRGKQHTVAVGDPALRPVRWWEWLVLRHRFPPRTPGN
jgi:hypothetical protein